MRIRFPPFNIFFHVHHFFSRSSECLQTFESRILSLLFSFFFFFLEALLLTLERKYSASLSTHTHTLSLILFNI